MIIDVTNMGIKLKDIKDSVINYDSPNGLERITYRETASSVTTVGEHQATLDLLQKVNGDFKKLFPGGEVKFVK